MKRVLMIFIGVLVWCSTVKAQQQPYYTQYVLNPFVYNPALAGIESYWDVKMSYRHQWQGIEGAPRTTYLTVNGPLKPIRYSKSTTGTVPRAQKKRKSVVREHWKNYKSIQSHAGVGMTVYNDQAGPLNIYSATVAYAYHVGLSPKLSLGMGLSAGVHGYRLNTDALNFGTNNPDDPAVGAMAAQGKVKPEFNFGVWFYSPFYFLGAAAQNVVSYSSVSASAEQLNVFDGRLVPHYSISAGYKFILNEDYSLLPSMVMRYVPRSPVTADVNFKLQYRDFIWTGVTCRTTRTFSFIMGAHVKSKWSLGYSYDFLSALGASPSGTHEVVVGILLGNKAKVLCPRDFW